MIHKFEVTRRNRINHFWTVYIYISVFIGFVPLMIFTNGIEDLYQYIVYAAAGSSILFVPTIYIHTSYLRKNRYSRLEINDEKRMVTYSNLKEGEELSFTFNEVEQMDVFKTPSLMRERSGWMPWDTYNYSIISIQNGKQITITSLLANELSLPIDNKKIKAHKVLYPYLRRLEVKERGRKGESDFPEIYVKKLKEKKLSEIENILQSPDDYDKKYILAAKHEFNRRKKSN